MDMSTEGLGLADRLGLWSEAVGRTLGGLRSEAFGEADFHGRLVTSRAGHLRLCRLEASSHRVVRTPELIRRSDEGYLKVVAQLHGRTCFQQGGRELWLSPGEWSVYDTTRAYAVTNPVSVEQLVVMIPKSRLPELPPGESQTVQRLSGGHGAGRLAWEAMVALYQELPALGPRTADGLADVLTQLIYLSLAEQARPAERPSQQRALRDRIVGHIARHLADPRLDVAALASAMNCSRRHLYNAFALEPDGVAGYLQKQRAALARRLLEDPRHAGRSLADIAQDCGFTRPAQLTQVFRSQFGLPPSAFRARQAGAQATAATSAPQH